jgi:hypothetical protein
MILYFGNSSKEFETIVDGLSDALDFSRTIGVDSSPPYEQGGGSGALRDVDFYTRCAGFSTISVFYLLSRTKP